MPYCFSDVYRNSRYLNEVVCPDCCKEVIVDAYRRLGPKTPAPKIKMPSINMETNEVKFAGFPELDFIPEEVGFTIENGHFKSL